MEQLVKLRDVISTIKDAQNIEDFRKLFELETFEVGRADIGIIPESFRKHFDRSNDFLVINGCVFIPAVQVIDNSQ